MHPRSRLANLYLEFPRERAKGLRTNKHVLTPHSEVFGAPGNGELVEHDTAHISSSETILACVPKSGDIAASFLTLALWARMSARALLSWWQMPHFCRSGLGEAAMGQHQLLEKEAP